MLKLTFVNHLYCIPSPCVCCACMLLYSFMHVYREQWFCSLSWRGTTTGTANVPRYWSVFCCSYQSPILLIQITYNWVASWCMITSIVLNRQPRSSKFCLIVTLYVGHPCCCVISFATFFACTTDFEIKLAVIVILFSDVSTVHLYNVPATVAHY